MPIFFRIMVNGLEIKSTRSRGAADNFYLTIMGMGTADVPLGSNTITLEYFTSKEWIINPSDPF